MGTGEVTRYLGHYGSARVTKAALLGADPAVPAQDRRQPPGRRRSASSTGIKAAIVADRYAYFKDFFDNFYNVDVLAAPGSATRPGRPASSSPSVRRPSRPACVDTWLTDFRADLPKIDVPTLVVHGTADRILPFEATARGCRALIKDLKLVEVEGGPHNIGWTHPEEVNRAKLMPYVRVGKENSGTDRYLLRGPRLAASRSC